VFAQEPVFFGCPFPPPLADTWQAHHGNAAGLDRRQGAAGQGGNFDIRQDTDQTEFGFRPPTTNRPATNPFEFAPMKYGLFGPAKLPGQLRIRQRAGKQ
jgi:hypothetical protein